MCEAGSLNEGTAAYQQPADADVEAYKKAHPDWQGPVHGAKSVDTATMERMKLAAPDITDNALMQARLAEGRRLQAKRGRKSTFLGSNKPSTALGGPPPAPPPGIANMGGN